MSTVVPKKPLTPDLVIAGVLLVVFAGALAGSFLYPPEAVLLPRLASVLGLVGAAWTVARGLAALRAAPVAAADGAAEDDVTELEQLRNQAEGADPDNAEEVFATASRAHWLTALGFAFGFLLVMWLAGIFVATALFSVAYLIVVGKKKWYFAVLYALVLTGALYALTRVVMLILTPVGVLLPGG